MNTNNNHRCHHCTNYEYHDSFHSVCKIRGTEIKDLAQAETCPFYEGI